jgi:hypothetical protein
MEWWSNGPITPLLHYSITPLFLLLLALPAGAELRAGAAKTSITPDPKAFSYQLGGYVSALRTGKNATGVHDTCYARALVISDGTAKAAVVSLDLCYLPANVKTAVAERVKGTGIPASGLFLSATHTHSALDPLHLHSANNQPAGALATFDPRLLEWMADRIAKAVNDADAALRPARAGSGQMGSIGLNRNRRGEMLTDDEMTALKVVGADGKPIAAVFNYAAHPVYYGADMLHVSGDWSGAFQRQMEAVLPGAVALFINGAEGDASANGADEGLPAERIETYSAKLGAKARTLYETIQTEPDAKVASWAQETPLPPAKGHPLFLLGSIALRATPQQAKELIERLMPPRCEVSFVRVGDLLLMGVPGEPTAAIGLAAKAAAKEQGVRRPAIVALTNGWLGYILTPEQYAAGKYEATMSFHGDQIGVKMLEGLRAGLKGWK